MHCVHRATWCGNVPTSRGSAPSNSFWDPTALHFPKQWTWLRAALCGTCCRGLELRNLIEFYASNDDDIPCSSHLVWLPTLLQMWRISNPSDSIAFSQIWIDWICRPVFYQIRIWFLFWSDLVISWINAEVTLIVKIKRVCKLYNIIVFWKNLLQSKT